MECLDHEIRKLYQRRVTWSILVLMGTQLCVANCIPAAEQPAGMTEKNSKQSQELEWARNKW